MIRKCSTIILLGCLLFCFGCGCGDDKPKEINLEELSKDELREMRDNLKNEIQELNKKIAELNKQIKEESQE